MVDVEQKLLGGEAQWEEEKKIIELTGQGTAKKIFYLDNPQFQFHERRIQSKIKGYGSLIG